MALHIETPLLESVPLGKAASCTVWLKMEALQPSGSFKIRGIGYACEEYRRRGATRFISSSGGNAGLAVAYAGRRLGVPVTVVVPETTSEQAKALIRSEGAEVIVRGHMWSDANAHALSLVGKKDAFLHPFDDPLIWKGHATMIDEVSRTGVKPDAVVLTVGGGGLLCGVVEGLHRNGWGDVPVVAVETQGAESFSRAVHAGRLVELAGITSVATSLGARMVCARALEWAGTHPIKSVVLSDKAAVSACLRFLDDHRLVVEPACGVGLAAVYDAVPELSGRKQVLVIVCGGVGTTVKQLEAWAADES